MHFLIILTQICLIYSFVNIRNTTNEFKYIFDNYKSMRYRRNINFNCVNSFVEHTDFSTKTLNYGEFLKYYDVDQCTKDVRNHTYVKRHIRDGLLVHQNVPNIHWDEYKFVFKKIYPSTYHERAALSKWLKNLNHVAIHNQEYLSGKHTYSLKLNHLADLGPMDYFKKILKLFDTTPLFDPAEDKDKTTYRKSRHHKTPRQVDWRTKGFNPRLEEQSQCGACYAFAVTHALQAQLYKKRGNWKELSPQQIIDCSYPDGNQGCDGGSLRAAFRYATRAGLIMEEHYPYVGKKGRCRYNSRLVSARPRRWAMLPPDEKALEAVLNTVGPLAVAVNAAPITFQLYRSGVYDDPFCVPWSMNHAMLLVGYTPEYWILLNWWGSNWGENGYMRIRRSFNRCGVINMAAYVEL